MRKAVKRPCAKSERYPRGVKWSGSVEYRGKQAWVGTFPTQGAWDEAAQSRLADLREQHKTTTTKPPAPTIAEFLGVEVTDAGQILYPHGKERAWPWTHPGSKLKKESSAQTLRDNIKPLVSAHGHERVDSFDRPRVREISADWTDGQKAAVRRMFGDVYEDGLIAQNHFVRLNVKQLSRLERNDFRIVSEAELERLLYCARRSRDDEYRLTAAALVLAEATIGVRPCELFALQWDALDSPERLIHIRDAIKNDLVRLAPLTAPLEQAIALIPRRSDFVFAAIRGGKLTGPLWSSTWMSIRAMAGLPSLEFYELKHRAITHMCTPRPDGLGLDPGDVAQIVGHQDGGKTIIKHYLKRDQRKAIARFHAADASWQHLDRQSPPRATPPTEIVDRHDHRAVDRERRRFDQSLGSSRR